MRLLVATLLQWERRWRWHAAKRGALRALAVAAGVGLSLALVLRVAPSPPDWHRPVARLALIGLLVGAAVAGAVLSARRPARLRLATALDRARSAVDNAIVAAAALGGSSVLVEEPALGDPALAEAVYLRGLRALETVEPTRVFPRLRRLGALAGVLTLGALVTFLRMPVAKVDGLTADELREARALLQELVARAETVHDDQARDLGRALLRAWPASQATKNPAVATEAGADQGASGWPSPRHALEEIARAAVAAAANSARAERALAEAAKALARAAPGPAATAALDKTANGATLEGRDDLLGQTLERLRSSAAEHAGISGGSSAASAGGLASALDGAAAALSKESDAAGAMQGSSAARDGEAAGGNDPDTTAAAARVLERLRRDLDDAARACANDPAACQRSLASAAASERDLAQTKGDAGLRRRLADLATSVARSRGPGQEGKQDGYRDGKQEGHRDGQRANGGRSVQAKGALSQGSASEAPSRDPTSASAGEAANPSGENNAASATTARAGTGTAENRHAENDSQKASPSQPPSYERTGISGTEGQRAGRDSAGRDSASTSEGVSLSGGGRGQKPGAPLAPSASDSLLAHRVGAASDEDLRRITGTDTGVGPSRAATIAGAATAGPVTAAYRRVFGEYAEVAERALSDTHVDPSHRALVERYFDAIHPK